MRVVAISDTHGRHRHVQVPDGDVLIHAGDITGRGERSTLEDFISWLGSLPHKHKIVIAGNHDFCFENENRREAIEMLLSVAEYLEDAALVIDGVKFWGSPWQPEFNGWAFNLPRGEALRKVWSQIPENTDILITHGPPEGILDRCPGGNVGDADLLDAVMAVNPKYHVFGHIHEGYGQRKMGETEFINASVCDAAYWPINPPVCFDV